MEPWNPCQIAAKHVYGECGRHQDRACPEAPIAMHPSPVRAWIWLTGVAAVALMIVFVSSHLFSISQ